MCCVADYLPAMSYGESLSWNGYVLCTLLPPRSIPDMSIENPAGTIEETGKFNHLSNSLENKSNHHFTIFLYIS